RRSARGRRAASAAPTSASRPCRPRCASAAGPSPPPDGALPPRARPVRRRARRRQPPAARGDRAPRILHARFPVPLSWNGSVGGAWSDRQGTTIGLLITGRSGRETSCGQAGGGGGGGGSGGPVGAARRRGHPGQRLRERAGRGGGDVARVETGVAPRADAQG